MRFTIKRDERIVADFETDDHEEFLTVEINGQPAVGFDLLHTKNDFAPIDAASTPKVIVGCWIEPDADEWRHLAVFPLPAGPTEV